MKYKHRGGSVAQSTPGATAFASSYLGPTKYKIIFYFKCVHFRFCTLLLSLAQSILSQEKQNSFNNFQLRFKRHNQLTLAIISSQLHKYIFSILPQVETYYYHCAHENSIFVLLIWPICCICLNFMYANTEIDKHKCPKFHIKAPCICIYTHVTDTTQR